MPLILNKNPNPQAVMLGSQHLRKIMLGEEIVWQRIRTKPFPPIGNLTLESLEHQNVKLKAVNRNGNLAFPMYFPPRKTDDYRYYLDRLTFISDTELSLQTIDGMLEADVVGLDMHFPMFFFDRKEEDDSGFDFRGKLTFIGDIPIELGMESMDGLLTADVIDDKHVHFPMVFVDQTPPTRDELLNRLTFIDKETA
jgi:hypothetical protein